MASTVAPLPHKHPATDPLTAGRHKDSLQDLLHVNESKSRELPTSDLFFSLSQMHSRAASRVRESRALRLHHKWVKPFPQGIGGGGGFPTKPRSPVWSHPKMQREKKIPSVFSSSSHLVFLTPLHHSLPTQTMTSFGCFVAISKLFICFCFF